MGPTFPYHASNENREQLKNVYQFPSIAIFNSLHVNINIGFMKSDVIKNKKDWGKE